MTVDEAKELKNGQTVYDTYFNRRGEVFGKDEDGFKVRYEGGDADEDILFSEPDNVADFEKI